MEPYSDSWKSHTQLSVFSDRSWTLRSLTCGSPDLIGRAAEEEEDDDDDDDGKDTYIRGTYMAIPAQFQLAAVKKNERLQRDRKAKEAMESGERRG